jgi:HJR/Mrr/RecB family endonuclease
MKLDKDIIKIVEQAERERARCFKRWIKEKANWEISLADAEIILQVTEAFLQAEKEGKV